MKWARGDSGNGRHAGGKRRQVEERGEGGAAGALRPTSRSTEPTETDWDSESPLLRHFAQHVARREQATVWGWRAEQVAEFVNCVRWAAGMRGGRRCRTHPFRDLVHMAGGAQDRGPQMAEDKWRRMLGEALPGLDLIGPREMGRRLRVQMLTELLQREGWYWRRRGTTNRRGAEQRGWDQYRATRR